MTHHHYAVRLCVAALLCLIWVVLACVVSAVRERRRR